MMNGSSTDSARITNMPDISVIVVCYNAIRFINSCFKSLINQDFRDHFEIIFVDNESTDGTLEQVRNFASRYRNVSVVVNTERNIAKSRNMGMAHARYPFVAFIDSDCMAPTDWLSRLAAGYMYFSKKDDKLVGVGGSNIPPAAQSVFYSALNIVLNTFIGSHGSVQGKRFKTDCYVSHLPTVNVMYRKREILRLGFDERLGNIGEDQDLSFRIQKEGFRVMYLADTAVVHYMRDTLCKWIQNMFVYGKGRARLMLKLPEFIEIVLFAPLFLIISVLLIVLAPVSLWFLAPFSFYLLFIFMYSVITAIRSGKPLFFANLFLIYTGTHLSYGVGEWAGLLIYGVRALVKSRKREQVLKRE